MHAGVGFLLHNRHYSNNSVVFSEDIGEGPGALFCLTNNVGCCSSNYEEGWYFPDSSLVHLRSEQHNEGVYRTRGSSFLRLHREINATLPRGLFCCKIPDESGASQTIYIGIYSKESGEGTVTCS